MTELVRTGVRRHPLAACETCPLNTPDYGYVPSFGPDRSQVALVGQNPGRNEIKYGKPFIGPSGKLLDKTLAAFQLERQTMFITNACLCTDISNPSFSPPPAAVQACRGRLITELKQHGVEKIVALGNFAAQSLLRTKVGITQLRIGPYRETDELPGVKIIPTFHPAACLRASASFPSMANDFQKLVTEQQPWEKPKTVVIDTERGALRAIRLLRAKYRKAVVDIEVAIDKDCLAPGTKVLRKDLTWVNIEDLVPGDDLIAFDEDRITEMKPSTVVATKRLMKQCYEIETDRGKIICSANHMWVYKTRGAGGKDTGYRWSSTASLYNNMQGLSGGWAASTNLPKYYLPYTSEPWEIDESRNGGYLAGFLDGEASLVTNQQTMIEFSQNVGPVADKITSILKEYNLEASHRTDLNRCYTGTPHESWAIGKRWDILRVLGMFRPERFMKRTEDVWRRRACYDKARILSIRPVGEREVVAIKTSTGTLIADGYPTHNSSFEHPNRFGILCIGVCVQDGIGIVFGERACHSKPVLIELASWFREAELIFQNGKFDIGGLHPLGFLDLKISQDTMLKSYVLDERTGIHGLKYNAVEKLGTPRYDEELALYIPKGGNYGHIPRPVLYRYNAYDVVATWALDKLFDAEISREDSLRLEPIRPRADGEWWGLRRLHDFLCEAATGFVYTELNGFAVDLVYNRQLQSEYRIELNGYERTMSKIVGPFNPRSPMQVKAVLHELDVEIPRKKNQKGVLAETTDAEALNIMLDNLKSRRTNRRTTLQGRVVKSADNAIGSEAVEVDTQDQAITFLETMLKHRKASKMDGTYVSGLRKHLYRGRVYPTVNLHTTSTGRLSQRKPSLQVIPRGDKLRRQFKVAKDDHVLIGADYGQLELRVLTWLAQEPYFAEIFRDPSRDLFNELLPVVRPERSYRLASASKKDKRIVIKAFVYGLAYGREAKSISDELDIPLRDAQAMYRDFFRVIPCIVDFREKTKWAALHGEDLISPFGRRRRFNLITDENKKDVENEAMAFYPQSIGSDICVQAFVQLRKELKGIAWCRNTIHDALYFETHQDNVKYVGDLMRKRMIESAYSVCGDYVPFITDVEVGRSWGNMIEFEDWIEGERPYPVALEIWKPPMFQEIA